MRCWVDDVNIASHIGSAVLLIFFRIILSEARQKETKMWSKKLLSILARVELLHAPKLFHALGKIKFLLSCFCCLHVEKIQHTKIGSNAKARKIDFCCFCHSAHCVRLLPYLNVSSRDMFKAHATWCHGVCTTLLNTKLILTFSTSMTWRRWKSLKKCKKKNKSLTFLFFVLMQISQRNDKK